MKLTGQFFWGQRFPNKDLTNVLYLWSSLDLAQNTAISGNWTDEIMKSNWWMNASSIQPTNTTTNGVWFDASHWLTNAGLPISSNVSFGFIIKIIDDGRFALSTRPSFIAASTNAGGGTPITFCTDFRDPFGQDYPLDYDNLSTDNLFNNSTAVLTNKWADIIFTQCITNNSWVGKFTAFTNGVQCVEFDTQTLSSGWNGNNASPAVGPTNNTPQVLMHNQAYLSGIAGYLHDVWVWTNGASFLGAQQIADFHAWRTNPPPYGLGLQ